MMNTDRASNILTLFAAPYVPVLSTKANPSDAEQYLLDTARRHVRGFATDDQFVAAAEVLGTELALRALSEDVLTDDERTILAACRQLAAARLAEFAANAA